MESGKKYLIIEAADPLINEYAGMMNAMVEVQREKVAIDIPPSAIQESDSGMISQMIVVAQHKREWIEALLFKIKFNFQRFEDVEDDYLEGREWAGDSMFQHWFFEMGKGLPFVCFFFNSIEARMFSINGDFFSDIIEQSKDDPEFKLGGFKLTEEQVKVTNYRLFFACLTFFTYCSGTGVDAQQPIENIIKELQAAFTFEQVKAEWIKGDYSLLKSNRVS